MKTIFGTVKEQKVQIETLTGQLVKVSEALDEAMKQNKDFEDKIKELEGKANGVPVADHEVLKSEKDVLVKKVTELEAQVNDLTNKAKTIDEAGSMKAMEILQSSGTPMIPMDPADHLSAISNIDKRYTITRIK